VIGFGGDQDYCHASYPPLTSIRYPGVEIGRIAARLLADQLRGKRPQGEVHRVASGEVAARESSDTIGIPDAEIARLLGPAANRAEVPLTRERASSGECLEGSGQDGGNESGVAD